MALRGSRDADGGAGVECSRSGSEKLAEGLRWSYLQRLRRPSHSRESSDSDSAFHDTADALGDLQLAMHFSARLDSADKKRFLQSFFGVRGGKKRGPQAKADIRAELERLAEGGPWSTLVSAPGDGDDSSDVLPTPHSHLKRPKSRHSHARNTTDDTSHGPLTPDDARRHLPPRPVSRRGPHDSRCLRYDPYLPDVGLGDESLLTGHRGPEVQRFSMDEFLASGEVPHTSSSVLPGGAGGVRQSGVKGDFESEALRILRQFTTKQEQDGVLTVLSGLLALSGKGDTEQPTTSAQDTRRSSAKKAGIKHMNPEWLGLAGDNSSCDSGMATSKSHHPNPFLDNIIGESPNKYQYYLNSRGQGEGESMTSETTSATTGGDGINDPECRESASSLDEHFVRQMQRLNVPHDYDAFPDPPDPPPSTEEGEPSDNGKRFTRLQLDEVVAQVEDVMRAEAPQFEVLCKSEDVVRVVQDVIYKYEGSDVSPTSKAALLNEVYSAISTMLVDEEAKAANAVQPEKEEGDRGDEDCGGSNADPVTVEEIRLAEESDPTM